MTDSQGRGSVPSERQFGPFRATFSACRRGSTKLELVEPQATGNGARHSLLEFHFDVLDYWRAFLRDEGIRVYLQSVKRMRDRAPRATHDVHPQ